ncbi:MAG: DnaD domain-containing protein [Eubacteriales bacterium]
MNLFDEGVDTVDALNAYIKRKDEFEDNVGKIRSLIGAGQRELTAKEKKCFTCWLDEWCFPIDVITRAYEVTVDKIGDPSVSYMNKVLENWKNSGLTTLEAVEASLENYKKKKAEAAHGTETVNGAESGFQTDEFFEAALRRSYRGAGNPEDIPAAKG